MAYGIENVIVIGQVSASQPCCLCSFVIGGHSLIDARYPYRATFIKAGQPYLLLA